MKPRFPIALPRLERVPRLPAAFAVLLCLALALQLVLTAPAELPSGGGAALAIAAPPPPGAPRVTVAGSILERPLFAPRGAGPGESAPATALGGAAVAGAVSVRGRSYAVVRRVDGTVVNLPVGGSIAGWRLQALGPEHATFARGGERIELPFGAAMLQEDVADGEEGLQE